MKSMLLISFRTRLSFIISFDILSRRCNPVIKIKWDSLCYLKNISDIFFPPTRQKIHNFLTEFDHSIAWSRKNHDVSKKTKDLNSNRSITHISCFIKNRKNMV